MSEADKVETLKQGPDYVFEIVEGSAAPWGISVRRVDMQRAKAKESLQTALGELFGATVTLKDIADVLEKIPQDWEFIQIGIDDAGKKHTLTVAQRKWEPRRQ